VTRPSWLELKIPPVVQAFAGALLMWLVALVTPVLDLSPQFRLAGGLAMAGVGFLIALTGIITFRRAGTTIHPTNPDAASSLVTSRIYRFTRNPMYLGIILVLFGWALFLASIPSLVVLPLFVLYITRFQIVPEERAMVSLFGSEYDAYRQKVRRWI
jgi:protein-S-isoprenylcysteine O-methyltransferase Ste14